MNYAAPAEILTSKSDGLTTNASQYPGTVLLLGNYRPTLAIARALGSAGYNIIVGLGGGEGFTERSRFVSEHWSHPELKQDGQLFAKHLQSFLSKRTDIQYVYPVAEEFCDFFASWSDVVPNNVTIVSPSVHTVTTCRDKVQLLNLAKKCGYPAPPFCVTHSQEDIGAAIQRLDLPLIARPLPPENRIGKKKALIIRTKDELSALAPTLKGTCQDLLIQKFISGERQDILFAANNGKLISALQVKYLRTDHFDGVGLCVHGEVVDLREDLVVATETFTKELDYNGIGCAQFVVNEHTGAFSLIEINPRTSALHAVTEKLGLGFSQLALSLAQNTNKPTESALPKYKPGLEFAWSYGEIRAIVSAWRDREIGFMRACAGLVTMLKTALRADLHLTWRWSDPLPTMMLFANQIFRTPGKVSSGSKDHTFAPTKPVEQLSWKVFDNFSDVQAVWSKMERDGIGTPFQKYHWLKCYHENFEKNRHLDIAIVTGYDAKQNPVVLFPLCVRAVLGLRRLEFLGQRLSDYNTPLIDRDLFSKLDKISMQRIWRSAVKAVGPSDYCSISRVPQNIFNDGNPFASDDLEPESSDAHALTLGAEWEAFAATHFSKSTLRRIREKERKLEKSGQLTSKWRTNSWDKEKFVELILKWKCDQLAATGARNALDDANTALFLKGAARLSGNDIGVFTLDLDDIPIAGIMTMETSKGSLIYLMAYEKGKFANLSTGVILLHRLIRELIERGCHIVDFSVGDEPYKLSLCDTNVSVWNRTEAFTWKGVLPTIATRLRLKIKRELKKSPFAMDVLQRGNKWFSSKKKLAHKLLVPLRHHLVH